MAQASPAALPAARALDPAKFRDPSVTARGEARAAVAFGGLDTLWANTGTLCNIACAGCYIESSPRNDALVYLSAAELSAALDEARALGEPLREVGFTGGEPFLNRELPAMLDEVLGRGLSALVLTNAMRPMANRRADLLRLRDAHGPERLRLRVSLDHYGPAMHDLERGKGSFASATAGLAWLAREGFRVDVAGRAAFGGESDAAMRAGYARLFAALGVATVDASDPVQLMLFPEMDASADVPEITTACWGILHKEPSSVMCASTRMLVRRKGSEAATYVACTLLPYEPEFDLGPTLAGARGAVPLNHPHCAKFCVLGGAACSR